LLDYLGQNCHGFDPKTGVLLEHLDSMSLVALVSFLSNQLCADVDLANFDISKFQTVDSLLRAIEGKKAA